MKTTTHLTMNYMCNPNPASLFTNSVKNNAFVQLNQTAPPKNTPTISRFKLFRHLTILSALLCFVVNGWGQCGPYQIYEGYGLNALPTAGGTWSANSMTYNGTPRTGLYASNFNASADNIALPLIANPGVLSFWYSRSSNSTAWSAVIETSIDNTSWTTRATIGSAVTVTFQQYSLDLGALGLTNIYIRIRDTRASGTHARYIDDLSLTSTVSSHNTILIQGSSCSPSLVSGVTYTVYDHGGNDQYNINRTTAPMILIPPTGFGLSINITSLGTESTYDFLKLFNGNSITASAIHPGSGWSGSTIPGVFSASNASNSLTIDFTSDVSTNGSGFIGSLSLLSACVAPTSLAATASSSAQSNTTLSASFTAASSAPTAYLVVRTDSNTQPVPVTGTTYTTGSNAIGFIEYVGSSAGTWTSTSLTPGTTYYYWVFSYNNTNCTGGPVYSASATSFSQSTSSCTGAALENLTYTTTTASYCFSTAITGNTATLGTTSGVPTYSISPALPTGLSLSTSTGTISGTPTAAVASANYTVTADNGCTNTTATLTLTTNALPATPTSSAATLAGTYGFTANWTASAGATAYLLDVSTSSSFTSMLSGYDGLNVGTVTSYAVTGLGSGTTYYYRVRSTNGTCNSLNSSSITIATTALTSVATGDWNSASTWSGGQVPTCNDNVTILTGNTVTVNSSSSVSKNTTINSGGTLVVASGDLTVGCTLNNTALTNNGTLTVTGGTLNVNGNISSALGSTFNQSGGDINIDGNNGGSATGSVASGTALFQLNQLNTGINLTGGTLTIVDPHANSTATLAIGYNNSTVGSQTSTANHTLRLGDGVSTDAGGNVIGFRIDPWTGSAYLSFGNIIVNGGSGTNRFVTIAQSLAALGNVTVTTGSTLNLNSTPSLIAAGNVTVNSGGTFINTSGIISGLVASNTSTLLTFGPSTFAQTIGGSGSYQNLATSPTANLTSLTINNTNASGVTISVPVSISGTLTMTAGKINTSATNLLTLGTTSAAGTLSYTAGQITGPFTRTFASSSSTTPVYDITTLFPVGDGTNYIPIHIDPVNGGGVVQMRGQAFNTNTGTAGTGVASVLSTDRWEALVTTGTITDCFIGLNDAQIASGNIIAQSSSANGTYNAVSGASTFVSGTPNALRTAVQIPNASYSGYFTYAAPGPVITSFTPTSVCPVTVGTITITGTNLGSATSVTLNGEACTITANTATSITVITDATPQAGNIVVTTAANSVSSASALSLFTLPTVTASSNASNNTLCSGTGVVLNGGGATSYVWNNGVSNSISFTPTSTSTYTVTGTDVNGCVNTANITITVNSVVSIAGQPINEVVLPNANATFSVTASGTGLTFQWELSTNSGSLWNAISNGGIYTGATTNTLTLTGVTTETGNQYRCVVSGTAPCGPVTSSVATLTISSTAISAQPQNQSICESSGSATFSVTTTGNAPSTIQWQVSTDGGTIWSNLSGETNTTLSLTGLTTSSNGYQYQCVLNGNVTSNAAILTVSVPSVAGSVSANQGICTGATPSSITLTGSTGTIQWQSSTDNSTFNDISGATSSTLAASTIGALNSTRYYHATVTNGGCSAATSGAVTVTVTPAPNAGTLSGTQTICANATTTFTSNGDTGGAWTSANTAIATANISSGIVTGVAAGTTTITYTITGSGGCSNATATRTVTVNAAPPITSATVTPVTICAGSSVSLSAASVTASSGTAIIGSGNTQGANNTTFLRVGNSVGNQFKNQYLFTAAELNAAGLTSGNITSLAFDVFVSGGGTVSNLTFKLGTTTLTNLTSSYVAGLTQVYTIGTYPVSGVLQVGIQTVNFTTPFNWDGTSNLVLEACSQLVSTGTAGDLRSSTTTFVSTITNNPLTTACGSSTGAGTVSVRPNFTFGGQVGTNNAANFSWSWNTTPTVSTATGTTTAVNNTSSSINQDYTVTATNATTGCTNTATTSSITINPVPTTPSANSTSICGPQNATCSVTGSGTVGNTFKWYTVSTGGTAISGQTASTLSAYPISTTTTLYASEANANCESARVAVIQTVSTPPAVTASASNATICVGQSTTLSATSSNSGYSYSWNNNGGSGSSVSVSPSVTTTYTVTATDASGGANNGCTSTATISITVNPLPTSISISPSSTSICTGSIQILTTSGGLVQNSGNVTVGSATTITGATSQPTAFCNRFEHIWQQMVFTASELNALGLQAGNITGLAFNIAAQGSATYVSDFRIRIGTTSSSTLSAFQNSGLNLVYNIATYNISIGSNTINFDTPYSWDGTSNIIIDMRQTGIDATNNATTYFTATTGSNTVLSATTSSTFSSSDNFAASNPSPTTSVNRLNTSFFGNVPVQGNITWSPTTALYTDAAATLAYTGTAAATVYAKPTTTTTYTATATSTSGCTSSNTSAITVSPTTVVGSVSAASSILCAGTGTTLSLTGNTGTIQWQNSSDNVTFANMSGETANSLSTGNLTQTRYYKAVVSSGACAAANTSTETITVNANGSYIGPNVGNWNDVANWCGGLPTNTTDVLIGSGKEVTLDISGLTTVASITLGGSLTLPSTAQLTVNGTLTNNGTFTLQDGATFVQGTSGTSIAGTGTYNVEKALTDNSSNWSTTSGRFWYMGVPMVNVARSSFGTPEANTNRLWSYSETGKLYTELSNVNDLLSAGTGYVHRRSIDGTLIFSATGANGLYSSNYTASGLTKTAGYTSGVNLVSNPYMAYLDWLAVVAASPTIDPTFYIRSNNVGGGDISALISYNANNPTLFTNTSSVVINDASQIRYIAPMQSVWVKVDAAASSGTVNMNRNMLSHQTGNGLKSNTVFPALAKVNLVDGNRFDQMLVFMNGDMSNEVDQYDSEKLPVSGTVQLYTMASNKKLVMNGLKNNKKKVSVPLYLELPETKSYTLQLNEYVLEDGLILLEDKQEGTMQDFTLLENYTFYANSGQLHNRFVLHFILPNAELTTQGPSNSWVGPETSYTDGGNVEITNDDRGNIEITVDQAEGQKVEGNVSVIDMNGKEVYKGQLDGITTAVSLNVPAGIYYLTVQSGTLFEKKKVFIQD